MKQKRLPTAATGVGWPGLVCSELDLNTRKLNNYVQILSRMQITKQNQKYKL